MEKKIEVFFFCFCPMDNFFVTSGKFALYNPVQWRSFKEGMTLNCTHTFIYFGPLLLHKIINQQHLNPRFVFHLKGFGTSGKNFHQFIFHWIGPTEQKMLSASILTPAETKILVLLSASVKRFGVFRVFRVFLVHFILLYCTNAQGTQVQCSSVQAVYCSNLRSLHWSALNHSKRLILFRERKKILTFL